MTHGAPVTVATGVLAGTAARGAYAVLRRFPPGGEKAWSRVNHRGEPVTLLEGTALAAGAITAEVAAAAVSCPARGTPGSADSDLAIALAGLGGLGFGVLDDLKGSGKRRGLRGHLGALAHGEVTTGTVKLAGLAVTGLAAALLERRGGQATGPGGTLADASAQDQALAGALADVIIDAGLIAGGANLLNLFDLRPGRAIKVAALSAVLIAAGSAAGSPAGSLGSGGVAAPTGAALALLPEDLGERAMLGDAGANALGAMLGAAAAVSLPRLARAGALAGIIALTVASEKVSFTKVIERTPPLRWLDMLGRRPPAASARDAAAGQAASGQAAAGRAAAATTSAGWWWLRPPGRHRRSRARPAADAAADKADGEAKEVSRVRSGKKILNFLKPTARQEP